VGRLNGKIKQRESVVRIFPNINSILRLMDTILMDRNEKCSQRKYMKIKGLTEDVSLKAAASP
jgi:hypothetical protein